MEPWVIVLIVVGSILVLLLTLLIAIEVYFYRVTFCRVKPAPYPESLKDPDMDRAMKHMEALLPLAEETKHERLEIRDDQGKKLVGYLYEQNDSDVWFITSHGFHGKALDDPLLSFPFVFQNKHNFLAITHQAHGESEGKFISFGIQEHKAILKWIDKLIELKGSNIKIYLIGVSMGAGTLLYLADKDMPANVRCIIADCGFTCAYDQFAYLLKQSYHMPLFFLKFLSLYIRIFKHVNLKENNKECLKHSKVPVLFICGEEDNFVPIMFTKENYEATSSYKEFYSFPKAKHGLSYDTDPERYQKIVYDFLKKVN